MKAAIFDVDGTLTDSVHLHAKAWQMSFEHFGFSFPFHSIRSQIGKGGDQLLPVFLSEKEIELLGEAIESHRSELFRQVFLPKVKPFARVPELFERMRSDGWKLALASSAKKKELQIYKEICGISDWVETDTSADDAAKSKPHPDIFLAAMERLGDVSPKDCVVLGDSPYDAEAASKVGTVAIGFLCGGFPETDLKKAGCRAVYWGASDLLETYESSLLFSGQGDD
jgi:HAD superfamily hydrolase (TIGR01509 family)